jgi:serine phosphatase RsbU (regulator of sigma subunit)
MEAVLAQKPKAPVAMVAFNGVDKARVLDAMRAGVVDVFEFDSDVERLSTLIEGAINRSKDAVTLTEDVQRERAAQLRELQRDQRAGRYIQMGMLPPSPMAIEHYRLRHKIYPSLMLSGDFVDYFRITDRHFAFYMADVAGHGASSAFVTVLLKNFSRRLRREYKPKMLKEPGEILTWLNRELLENKLDKHVAMFVGVVDVQTDRLAYANAGHFPGAILVDPMGSRYLEMAGKPVGLFPDVVYASAMTELASPCTLFMLSDGILEVLGKARLAAKEARLLDAALEASSGEVEIWDVLDLASRHPNPDDMSCLVVTKGT